jgi:hypothetical protein
LTAVVKYLDAGLLMSGRAGRLRHLRNVLGGWRGDVCVDCAELGTRLARLAIYRDELAVDAPASCSERDVVQFLDDTKRMLVEIDEAIGPWGN